MAATKRGASSILRVTAGDTDRDVHVRDLDDLILGAREPSGAYGGCVPAVFSSGAPTSVSTLRHGGRFQARARAAGVVIFMEATAGFPTECSVGDEVLEQGWHLDPERVADRRGHV